MAEERRRKVFGVGFHRTGTTSLHTALDKLGYRVIGMEERAWAAFERSDFDEIKSIADEIDGFRDMPWPLIYQWLDKTYPDARFVLTVRETRGWIRSCVATYKDRPHPMFPIIYGFDSFAGNEEIAAKVYEEHIADVRRYFAGRDNKFVEIDFTAGQGWNDLCGFLSEPIPKQEFPHGNASEFTFLGKIKRKLMKWFWPEKYRRREWGL